MPDICANRAFVSVEKPDDLSRPDTPQAPYFDPALEAWVLSRYADVVASLRDSRSRPVGHTEQDPAETDQPTQIPIRRDTQRALSALQLLEWQSKIERLARGQIGESRVDRPVDLVSEVAEPWCTDVAMIVTGADARDRERLVELARIVSAAAADPGDPDLKDTASAASSELERCVPSEPIPMGAAAFVALAQTLPGFLARAWLALLRHPSELSTLYARPDLMPEAIEELLRYAGLARRVTRIARAPLNLGGAHIAAGQKMRLKLSSANRDPEQFAEPNRLDLTRRGVQHLALGAGPHSCAGAPLIRMASKAATVAFVQEFRSAILCEPVEWRGGAAFRAPASVLVRFRGSLRGGV